MHHVPLDFQCLNGCSDERGEDRDEKEGREWLLHTMLGWSAEVCRTKGLKINAGKSKMKEINGEEGLECEVHIDGIH